jgi:hypothetical protein
VAIQEWAEAGKDAPGSEHRLLILTSPELMRCMKGVTLRENDQVLMLRTWLDDAKAVGPVGRTHVLNLSYAKAVRQAVERYNANYQEIYADTLDSFSQKECGPYKIYRTFCSVHVADSIVETLHELFPEKKIGYPFDNTNENTGLFDIENWGLGEIDEQQDQSAENDQPAEYIRCPKQRIRSSILGLFHVQPSFSAASVSSGSSVTICDARRIRLIWRFV